MECGVQGLLRFFGVLLQISSLVLGLTLLAWGNSIPDLITDVAMARTGCAPRHKMHAVCMHAAIHWLAVVLSKVHICQSVQASRCCTTGTVTWQ